MVTLCRVPPSVSLAQMAALIRPSRISWMGRVGSSPVVCCSGAASRRPLPCVLPLPSLDMEKSPVGCATGCVLDVTSGGQGQELAGLLVGLGPLPRELRLTGDAREGVDHGEDRKAALLRGDLQRPLRERSGDAVAFEDL